MIASRIASFNVTWVLIVVVNGISISVCNASTALSCPIQFETLIFLLNNESNNFATALFLLLFSIWEIVESAKPITLNDVVLLVFDNSDELYNNETGIIWPLRLFCNEILEGNLTLIALMICEIE